MRSSRGRRVALAHRDSLETAPAADRRAQASPAVVASDCLSPQEQRRRVIDVASAFDGHYLATIDFFAERNLTVGIVKPVRGSSVTNARAVQVCVDARGNVSVSQAGRPCRAVAPAAVAGWLAALATLGAALIAWLG